MSFARFRPFSHFIAPHSWSNDPCGAVFIPETQEYIVCYQWHPGTTVAGNSAWGMARSRDLVTWKDCAPAIRNGDAMRYDSSGVFSGCIVSRLIEGKRVLILFYTSIAATPIHWSIDYLQGESQSMAYSIDYGHSWKKLKNNPLLRVSPARSKTTGWRDPFVSYWPSLSRLRGKERGTNYMLISSGRKGNGPELHLYESDDLLAWTMVSTILSVTAKAKVSDDSHLRWGHNFECSSFFTLNGKDYILLGVEGDVYSSRYLNRYTMWICGTMAVNDQFKPRFHVHSHGLIDHGILYAPHIFRDQDNNLLQLGWADEDVTDQSFVAKQGWAGCVTLPRELFEITAPMPSSGRVPDNRWQLSSPASTMTTLGIRPAAQRQRLRTESKHYSFSDLPLMRSKTFELTAHIPGSCLSGNETIVLNIRQAPNSLEVTSIVISLPQSSVTIDRSKSSSLGIGNPSPEYGAFLLLRNRPGNSLEDLTIHVLVDNSILEIFLNDRFALTSRIYPTLDDSLGTSCDFGAIPPACITFRCCDGLVNAWPERPAQQHTLAGDGDTEKVAAAEYLGGFEHVEVAEPAVEEPFTL